MEAENGQCGETTRSPTDVDRRQLLEATAGGALGISLAGCLDVAGIAAGSDAGEPIRIGMLVPDAGDDLVGRSMRRTGRIVADELSANGGVDGRDVEVVIADTQGSALTGRRSYQELVLDDGVDVTTGVYTSDVLEYIMDDIAEQETLHLTAGAATTTPGRLIQETYDDYKYQFRVGPTNAHHLAQAQLDFMDDMAADIGWDSVAILAEDYEWNRTPWNVLQERLPENGVDVAMAERYRPSMIDFSDLYDEAEQENVDMVFLLAAHTGDAALLEWKFPNVVRSETMPQFDPRPFDLGGIYVPIQHPSYGPATDGLSRYALANTGRRTESELTRASRPFAERYLEANGRKPMHQSYHVYDAITLYAEAVERAGTLDTDELVAELEAISVTGTTGTIEFYDRDERFAHDRVYDPDETTYIQWQENEDEEPVQEIIWPSEHATAPYEHPLWLEHERSD